jgi:malate synthase
MDTSTFGPGIEILGPITSEYSEILTPEAIAFVARLERMFGARRRELLERRAVRQRELDAGKMPGFLAETAHVRNDLTWRVAPVTNGDLQDRRVEITGPVERKMVINALNCGASTFMADFEDANTPTWT